MNIFVFSERYNNGFGILLNVNIEWMHSDLYHYFGSVLLQFSSLQH